MNAREGVTNKSPHRAPPGAGRDGHFLADDSGGSYDGLQAHAGQALVRHAMGREPLDGALYVFVNRRGTQLKCLYVDRSGFCIWAKRLEAGRFVSDWRRIHTQEMDWMALKLLLEGLEGRRVRKRFALPS